MDAVTLRHQDSGGETRAVVIPRWGMNVIAMTYQPSFMTSPLAVLEPVEADLLASRPTGYGMPLLAPTPGRVGEGQSGLFRYRGKTYHILPSRHGFVRDLPWSVEGSTDVRTRSRLRLSRSPGSHGTFPFEFEAQYDISISSQTLRASVSFVNMGELFQPINVGWHPYFHRTGPVRVMIPARAMWELTTVVEPTPTGLQIGVVGDSDFQRGRMLREGEHWDHVFTGLESSDGICRCWIDELSRHDPLDTTQGRFAFVRRWVGFATKACGEQKPFRHAQLFTPISRHAICLEPLSSPPDAINMRERGVADTDVCDVAPGECARFDIEIGVDLLSDLSG